MSRTLRRTILTLAMLGGLLLLTPLSKVAFAQNFYNTTYWDTDPEITYPQGFFGPPTTVGHPDRDNTIRIVNPTANDPLCAQIYVYDDDEQQIECCGCPVSKNGFLQLSVEDQLTANPFDTLGHTHGIIEIVASLPNAGPSCDPTAGAGPIVPTATLREWITHEPRELQTNIGTFPGVFPIRENLTEEQFLWAPLTGTKLLTLEHTCSNLVHNGSGKGVCRCAPGPDTTPFENPFE